MQRCLELAGYGLGRVAPNPMVGAVIVYDGKIIGEGYHHAFGEPHAEVNAIKQAIEQGHESMLQKSTLYVSLEPCNHHGKTPPCTELIISKKIPNVIVGCNDPFPEVNGSGIKRLMESGVNVFSGLLDEECREVNKRFFKFHQEKRPYVILKYAQTSNHLIAPLGNGNKKISNEYSDMLVHKWRSEEAAIMVGTKTAEMDNPSLTVRNWKGKNPLRIVIDRTLRLPKNLNLFNNEATSLIINEHENLKNKNIEYLKIDFGIAIVPQVLKLLYERQIMSVIVEGGTNLISQFIENNLWDEARIITTSKFFEGGVNSPVIHGSVFESTNITGDNIVILRPYKK